MKIKYLGHSSFQLTSLNGARIVCDPYSPEIGITMPAAEADIVTLSHRHYDHAEVSAVHGSPKVIEGGADVIYKDIEITSVPSLHDNLGGARRGTNAIFKFTSQGITVCHLGDLGEDIGAELAKRIGGADVLLIPVGGTYTIDAAQAWQLIGLINPSVVIPMHYKTEGCNIDIRGVEQFLSLCKDCEIDKKGGEVLVSPADINNGKLKVWVMERSR